MNNISGIAKSQENVQEELGSLIWDKLKNGKYEEVLSEIKAEKYHKYLIHNSLDIVPVILKILAEDIEADGEKCVGDMLTYIASIANCKETLLAFMEELELNRSEVYLRVLLQPMQILLLRQVTEKTRPTMFSWVFNTLYSHVAMLDLPKSYNLEGKERKLLDLQPEVQVLTRTLQWLTDFYMVFYKKVMSGDLVWGGKVTNSKHFLAYFLLQLFHKPLTFLDVFCAEEEVESSLHRVCNKLTVMIAHLLGNSFRLFDKVIWKRSKTVLASEDKSDKDERKSDDRDQLNDASLDDQEEEADDKSEESEKESVSQMSLACYFYCVLSQNMASEYMPCVHSHQYVFLNCLPLIVHLLEMKEDAAIHKGLMLAKDLLSKMSEKSLSNDCLESKAHSSFPQLLIRIMTFCESRELRTTALAVFRPYLRKFENSGRRNLIKCLLISVKHSGVLGLVIHDLKENVAQCLNEETVDPNFCGSHLEGLVLLACSLPDGETTDLLEWSDSIMAALNLLIFLFVRDKEDRTGVKKLVPSLQKDFLECISRGLDLSRAHYELKLREYGAPGKKKGAEVTVNVKGIVLPNMPPEQEKKVLETALCSFDMMQCVLARAVQVVH